MIELFCLRHIILTSISCNILEIKYFVHKDIYHEVIN